MSTSVSVEFGTRIFGVKSSVSVTQSFSVGGSVSYGSSTSETTSTGTQHASGAEANYKIPGGAMIIGFRKRYVFDKSNLPAEMTVTCKGGRQFKYPTKIRLLSKSFGQSFYKKFFGEFLPGKCTDQRISCVYNEVYKTFEDVEDAGLNFKKCFPPGIGKN